MTDDVKNDKLPPVVDKIDKNSLLGDQQEDGGRQFSDFEKKMMNHGWNPDGELNAEEWIDNGFKVKQKKLDSLFNSVEKLKEKLATQERSAYAKAKADLEAQRIEAIEMADVQRVKEIEQHTRTLVDPSVKEHVDAFMTKHNAWLNGTSYRDQEMQHVCRQRDQEIYSEGLPPEQHFEKLENYMRGKYPDYFQVEPEPIANAVEGRQQPAVKNTTAKKKMTFDDLDEFQKKAALNLQKSKGISIEDYIKQLQELDKR